MKYKQPFKEITAASRQIRLSLKLAAALGMAAAIIHLFIGADIAAVLFCITAVLGSFFPLAYLGALNIAALLIALVGFRYVGFPLIAKLAMGQELDSYLRDPSGSFGVVLLGIAGYLLALQITLRMPIGRPLLKPVVNRTKLGRISFLAALIGITANLAVAFRAGEQYSGVTIAEFFVPFLHLALVSAIARAIQSSDRRRRSVDVWVVVLLVAEVAFAMVRNSRMALVEILLCLFLSIVAFEGRIRWRQFAATAIGIGMMVTFVTPVFLFVRSYRGDLSWTQRIDATVDAVLNLDYVLDYYMQWKSLQESVGWYQNYYGSTMNVFDRMSHVNDVDLLKSGADRFGIVGTKDLYLAMKRAIPRVLAPDKPTGYSQGYWLFTNIGISNPGPYPNAPLIGTGYVAFGWAGAFLYPFVLGGTYLLMIKKISGWDLRKNIWAIYFFMRVHNQFVEGSSDSYMAFILRHFPQDFILLWLLGMLVKVRFLRLRFKGRIWSYGK